jgi:transposase
MNPVVGLDISKGESQVQAFLDKGKPYSKSFKVNHTLEGLSSLVSFLENVKQEAGKKPSVILEATGHYQTPVVQYLEERGYLLVIINPLISYKARGSSLRKVKTDAIDAYLLCELFYKEELEPYKKRGVQLLNLRNLTRQHENITGVMIQTKLQFQAVLEQVFPEYRGVFGDLYSVVSLSTLSEFPSSEDMLRASEADITDRIVELCKSRSINWANEKAIQLKAAAARNPFEKTIYQSHILSLGMYKTFFFSTKNIYQS